MMPPSSKIKPTSNVFLVTMVSGSAKENQKWRGPFQLSKMVNTTFNSDTATRASKFYLITTSLKNSLVITSILLTHCLVLLSTYYIIIYSWTNSYSRWNSLNLYSSIITLFHNVNSIISHLPPTPSIKLQYNATYYQKVYIT